MRLKALVLGLIILGTAFGFRWSAPNLMTLPNYTNNTHFYLGWQWDNSSMTDNFYDNWACDNTPCFIYYEICENEIDGICANTFYSNFSFQRYYVLQNKAEGSYTYMVRAKISETQSTMGDAGIATGTYTDWSNKTGTVVDYYPPRVFASSDKTKYAYGERVYLTAYALDSSSGVNQTALIFSNPAPGLINSSWGWNVTYSEIFGPGSYSFVGAAMDKAGQGNISSIASFEVSPSSPYGPPNISINSIKGYYSNNETAYLTVVANDSNGLGRIEVIINGTKIDACKREFNDRPVSYSYNCTSGPYLNVKNWTSALYQYNAIATGVSNLSAISPDRNFKVFGNSSCNDFGYPVNSGQCASNGTQSFFCACRSDGCALLKKCTDVCYCPSGFLCNSTSQVCSLPSGASACSDGTPYGQCSITLPKYCSNGALIDNCSKCGCSAGYNCSATSNSCYVSNALCGNGLCEAGESASCCRDCGCSDGKMCNITNDKCYVPPGPVTYIALSLVSPNVTDISLSPGQTVRFVLELKDENKGLVNNATVTVYPPAEKYTSSFIGDGQYEVVYQARTNTASYFQEYTINLRAKRYLNAQEQFSQTLPLSVVLNRFLDIYFVTPQQNQTVTESQPVEVKIEYPDGSPVLVGSFDMLFGEKTIQLALSGDTYRAFLNLTNESYGAKNATFIGRDNYNNTLNNILVVYYTQRIDYTVYFVALLFIVGGSAAAYFLYTWGSGLSKDYKMLKKEKVYLETMDKRTHLEFFKRHIDESTFKKLVLEYQQKTTDVDKIVVEMEKRHRWLRWL